MITRSTAPAYAPDELILAVTYDGDDTIRSLANCFEGREYFPVSDDHIIVGLRETLTIDVRWLDIPAPRKGSAPDLIYPSTREIDALLLAHGVRGLNVPETLSLALMCPGLKLASLGQVIKRRFEAFALFTSGKAAMLLPREREWRDTWRIPITPCADPIAKWYQ